MYKSIEAIALLTAVLAGCNGPVNSNCAALGEVLHVIDEGLNAEAVSRQRDAGRIELDGVPISPTDTAHAQRLGIGTVYQEVNLLPNMSVADNLFIGHEPRRFGFIDRGAMTRQASAIMASHGFEMDVTLPLDHYSVAMQQIVAIARAVSLSARILILDEPTASLDASEVQMLFSLMTRLRDQGVSLIFITHFLDQVYAISDRITVLRNGELVGTRDTAALPQLELVKMMLGRELDDNALKRAGKTLRSVVQGLWQAGGHRPLQPRRHARGDSGSRRPARVRSYRDRRADVRHSAKG